MGVKSKLAQGGDGTAIPAGFCGNLVTSTNTVAGSLTGDNLITSITVNKGIYLCHGNVYLRPNSASSCAAKITTGASISGTAEAGLVRLEGSVNGDTLVCMPLILNVTADGTTINLRGYSSITSGAAGFTGTLDVYKLF